MYVEEFNHSTGPVVQGFVKAEWPAGNEIREGIAVRWVRLFTRSAALWAQLNPLSVAVRVMHEPRRPVTTIHSFVVPKVEEQRLRLVLAAFLRTDSIAAGHTETPQSAEELATAFLHQDARRLALVPEELRTAGGNSIHVNLRLADYLPRILKAAIDLMLPFAYQAQIATCVPPREMLRSLLYNAAHLQDESSVPRDLIADQAELAARLKRAQFHIEECVYAPPGGESTAVAEAVAHVLAETIYGPFGAGPELGAVNDARAGAFARDRHSHFVLGTAATTSLEDVTAAATREDVGRVLECRALGLRDDAGEDSPLFDMIVMGSGPTADAPPGTRTLGSVGSPTTPFLFVSYARVDGPLVYPLTDRLQRDGSALWIDRRLLAGDDWLDELEAQLNRCAGVLAFVSPSFAASRYCGREVRYADALSRKIIPVVLQPVQLAGGLNIILQGVQKVPARDSSAYTDIVSAIKRHAPAVWHPDGPAPV